MSVYDIDFAILDFIQKLHTSVLDRIFAFITHLGDGGQLWIILAVCLMFSKKYRRSGINILLSLLIVSLLTSSIKETVMRPRPFEFNEYVTMFIARPKGYSFPSGHTSSSAAAAASLWLTHRKEGRAAILAAALIAFSRLYFYVHFTSDVLVGAILGALTALCVYLAQKRAWRKLQ